MTMRELSNAMRLAAEQGAPPGSLVRVGTVSSYDPALYAARVRLQPEDIETGWLPIVTQRAGNGWGLQLPPSLGDVVVVLFQEGSIGDGLVVGMMFGDRFRPQEVPAGEFVLRHESGSQLHFANDGSVRLVTAGELHIEAGGAITSSAPAWNHDGPINVDGLVTVTTDVIGGGKSLKTHIHSGVARGGSVTDPPV